MGGGASKEKVVAKEDAVSDGKENFEHRKSASASPSSSRSDVSAASHRKSLSKGGSIGGIGSHISSSKDSFDISGHACAFDIRNALSPTRDRNWINPGLTINTQVSSTMGGGGVTPKGMRSKQGSKSGRFDNGGSKSMEYDGKSKSREFVRNSILGGMKVKTSDDAGPGTPKGAATPKNGAQSPNGNGIANGVELFPEENLFRYDMWQNEDFMVKDHPKLADTSPDKRNELMISKLHLCTLVYDFASSEKAEEKKIQMETIKEIIDFVENPPYDNLNSVFTDAIFSTVINCFEENCFQPSTVHTEKNVKSDKNAGDGSSMSSLSSNTMDHFHNHMEPAWPYLKLLYDLIMKYILKMGGAILKTLIDRKFCSLCVEKLNSTDQRERETVKTLLTKIYVKFFEHRQLIRKCINDAFYRFIYETGKHNGITELLGVLEPIISGYKVPLKQEHFDTLQKSLVPLHKAPYEVLTTYHKELRKLLMLFIEKDPDKCGSIIIKTISQYWPVQHGPKQVLMITELEEILEETDKDMWETGDLAQTRPVLYKLVSTIVGSEHFQVAEKGLRMWHNKFLYEGCFSKHDFGEEVLTNMFYNLYFKSHDHWQNNDALKPDGAEISSCKVGELSLKVLYGYKKVQLPFYEKLAEDYKVLRKTQKKKKISQTEPNLLVSDPRWEQIEKMAEDNRKKREEVEGGGVGEEEGEEGVGKDGEGKDNVSPRT